MAHFPMLSLTFLFIFLPHFLSSQPTTPSSIYDHLQLNGLPIGLLPKGITDFSIDSESHRFRVNLTQPCNAKFETQLHYDFNVSGVLSYGKIDELSGVSQQELFLWFPVKGIRVDDPSSGLIHFDVGVVDKQFSLSLFESPRDCTAADRDPSEHSEIVQPGYGFCFWFCGCIVASVGVSIIGEASNNPATNQFEPFGDENDQQDMLKAIF